MKIELTEGDAKAIWLHDAITSNSVKGESCRSKAKPSSSTNRKRGHFECLQCGRSYGRKDSLQRHLMYECGKEPQFQCPFCPQKFKRKTHQVRHIKRQHKDKIGLLEENNPDLFLGKQF
ncbi:hypothetical protein ILUMI_00697 [Ignelater luminosus]|uniref:C2H2-type domain-containing protein n=1 Tax=Ignelater luminosus TaxID=2038154 RepID=A0A8K0DL40_IGNLU|nr:hypothetical protein ILUMI_00697 [Ignelater luminosus]